MKIARLECLHADAGFRNFNYVKITTDDGLIGWSEYNESFGGLGVTALIENLAPVLLGEDPRAYESLVTLMFAIRRQASGGAVAQAIGAIENAMLDLKAKALGIPVYEMLGGKLPFDGSGAEVARANLLLDPPLISQRVPYLEVDPLLEAFARRLMAKKRDARPPTAKAAR